VMQTKERGLVSYVSFYLLISERMVDQLPTISKSVVDEAQMYAQGVRAVYCESADTVRGFCERLKVKAFEKVLGNRVKLIFFALLRQALYPSGRLALRA
jgi:hypothetical protein